MASERVLRADGNQATLVRKGCHRYWQAMRSFWKHRQGSIALATDDVRVSGKEIMVFFPDGIRLRNTVGDLSEDNFGSR